MKSRRRILHFLLNDSDAIFSICKLEKTVTKQALNYYLSSLKRWTLKYCPKQRLNEIKWINYYAILNYIVCFILIIIKWIFKKKLYN